MIEGLNHVTLAVREIQRSFAFYHETLGLRARARWPKGAYFSAQALWLCIVQDDHTRTGPMPEYTHLAFHVSPKDFPSMSRRLMEAGCAQWKENISEGDSLYFLDPDGHKLEIHTTDLEARLAHASKQPWDGLQIL